MFDHKLFKLNNYRFPYINSNKHINDTYSIECFVITKPFIYPIKNTITERTNYNNNNNCYYNWDISAKKMLNIFPELNIYFEFIKTFREVNF